MLLRNMDITENFVKT